VATDTWLGGPTPGAPPVPTSLEELRAVAREQRGLVTRRQCLAAGLTARAVDMRLEKERWTRLQRGVYLTLPGRDDWRTQALAALLACGPDAAWSHWTAAHVWGLAPTPPRLVEILVPHSFAVAKPDGARVRRARHLDDRVDPLRWPWLTTVEETILDIAATADLDETFAVMGRAFQRFRTTEPAVLSRLSGRAKHPCRALLTEVLSDAEAGAESAMELRFVRDVERAHGLPSATRQMRTAASRRDVHDVAYPEQRVLVELDGRLWHEWGSRTVEGLRDRRSAADGWLTVRAFWMDVLRPCSLAVEISAILRTRGWQDSLHRCRRPGCSA
jgi:hypothetical protein